MDNTVDKRLGRYELRRPIGRGAAGTVYEAWDATLTRRVAIKVVRPGDRDRLEIEELVTRFRQEAQVTGRLSHPGVVQVFDYGEVDGEAYIVMEFVDGETLKAALDRAGRLPPPQAAAVIRELLGALEHCHRLGVVHRDIKPSNIMLPAEGGVKLADFGIARVENSELTLVGTVMGTAPYMSPEQFTGRDTIDARSDIWACGVVLYEMLTGTRPYTGNTGAMIGQAVVNDPVEPPSKRVAGLTAAFDGVVQRALRKPPGERFPTAQAFAAAVAAATPAAASATAAARRKRPWLAIAGGAGALAVVGAVAAWLLSGGTATPPKPAAIASVPLAARVAALSCSTVQAVNPAASSAIALEGIIGSGEPRSQLDAIVADAPAASVHVAVQTFPWSELSCRLAELVRANQGASRTRLAFTGGQTTLANGADIRLKLTMPDFDGEVRLDDLNSDGLVDHLMEANFGAAPRHRAGAVVGLGPNGDDLIGRVSPPFGTDIVVAVVTSEPLFSSKRPVEEAGAGFVDALDAALAALRRRGGRVAADAAVLTTVPR